MNRDVLLQIISDLREGCVPHLNAEDFPCFGADALLSKPQVPATIAQDFAAQLTEADIPVLERALRALDEGELAWLGVKVVWDADAAMANVDNEVTKKYGEQGSADGQNLLFFCSDAKEIVSSRAYSPRDTFQMKDCTRGPSMHNDQFDGLTWAGIPLFDQTRVWLLGASDAASEVSTLAEHVGFRVMAVDYDPAYLNEQRFPRAERILLPGMELEDLSVLPAAPGDYVCVLTRGHMFDPQGCVWAAQHGAHYIGMMGCKGKNNTVHDLVISMGMTEEQWDSVKRPIGLKFGAKTPAELAIAIVAELVDVRYKQRYSKEAIDRHEKSLGRA